jgi:Predicted Zn-dependent peptidases
LETAKKKAKMYFGDWKKGTIEELKFEVPKAPSKNSLHFAHKDGAVQSIVSVSYPIDLKPGTEDVVPAMVANKLFGGYHKSILNTVVREEKAIPMVFDRI